MHPDQLPFLERVSRLLMDEGIPRIGGRIYGRLLLTDEALSLDDLVAELGASKGSVSSNVRLLEDRGMLELVSRPGDRKDYYRLTSDGVTGPLALMLRRLGDFRRAFADCQNAPIESPVARNRLRLALSLYDHVLGIIDENVSEWRARTKAQAG